METRFIPSLVALSFGVAIFSSYVALNLAHSVTQARGRAQALWLACGALAMGVGIWSMHFIGMLAFEMPGMSMAYDIPLMILSIVVAVGASALALFVISRPIVATGSIVSGGIAMAAAIAGMHYIGMYSMRMAARIEWNLYLVVASILIALGASFGALLILTKLRNKMDRLREMLLAATIMGFAIAGMHYTGMFAATFVHDTGRELTDAHLLVTSGLEMAVVIMPLMILLLALFGSVSQRILVTRTKAASENLGKSEERFRLLVEAVKDYAIFMLDTGGRITTWNLGAERITGYRDAEIVGRHVDVLYAPADRQAGTPANELAIAKATGHFEGETESVRKDGSVYWANVVIAPLYDRDGKHTGFSRVTRDITDVKHADTRLRRLNEDLEERVRARTLALEESGRQLRTMADAIPALIAKIDRHERFVFANDAFHRWFDRAKDAIVGRSFRDVLGPTLYAEVGPQLRTVLAGKVTAYERTSKRGGRTTTLAVTFVPELAQDGAIAGFIILATDITKHKEIQAELKAAKEAAEVANATKSAFLANMSHEIRTPLGAVLGFSELLGAGEMTAAERADCIEVIKRNGAILSSVINDILDLSKVEAGKLEIERTEVRLADVMSDIGAMLNLQAVERGLELKITAEGAVPPRIATDPLRLRQILLNVIGNAVKFTKSGSVSVKAKMLPDENGVMKLAFVVSDTGIGIAPEQAVRLFSPFVQADVSTTRQFGGTGLGLALSKRLAAALGGDIRLLESEPSKGSTFVVTIDPGTAETVLFQSSVVSARPKDAPGRGARSRLDRLDVLLVDDSADNRLLVAKILKRAGAPGETANNGREAVVNALCGDFDLILLDLQMPVMDGFEATRTLRSKGYKNPIVALTAHAMNEERQRTLQCGFSAHLSKPIDQGLLLSALDELSAAH
jgi:PAS domain S-box-containing protein